MLSIEDDRLMKEFDIVVDLLLANKYLEPMVNEMNSLDLNNSNELTDESKEMMELLMMREEKQLPMMTMNLLDLVEESKEEDGGWSEEQLVMEQILNDVTEILKMNLTLDNLVLMFSKFWMSVQLDYQLRFLSFSVEHLLLLLLRHVFLMRNRMKLKEDFELSVYHNQEIEYLGHE